MAESGLLGSGGLMRYNEEYDSKFKFGPEVVIGMVIATIVLAALGTLDFMYEVYYVLGSGGGLILLIGILQVIFGVNRWYYKKIRDMRDMGDVQGLKKYAYGMGAKATIAMYALVDLGEMDLTMARGFTRSSKNKQSLFDE